MYTWWPNTISAREMHGSKEAANVSEEFPFAK